MRPGARLPCVTDKCPESSRKPFGRLHRLTAAPSLSSIAAAMRRYILAMAFPGFRSYRTQRASSPPGLPGRPSIGLGRHQSACRNAAGSTDRQLPIGSDDVHAVVCAIGRRESPGNGSPPERPPRIRTEPPRGRHHQPRIPVLRRHLLRFHDVVGVRQASLKINAAGAPRRARPPKRIIISATWVPISVNSFPLRRPLLFRPRTSTT